MREPIRLHYAARGQKRLLGSSADLIVAFFWVLAVVAACLALFFGCLFVALVRDPDLFLSDPAKHAIAEKMILFGVCILAVLVCVSAVVAAIRRSRDARIRG